VREGGREGGRGGRRLKNPDAHFLDRSTHMHRLEYHPRSPTLIPSLLVQGLATVETAMPQHIANSLNGLARLGGEGKGEERDTFIQACIVRHIALGCVCLSFLLPPFRLLCT